MHYLGKRKRSDLYVDNLDAESITTKSLRITDEYGFPEQKGDVGDILVQQVSGDLAFEPPAEFPTEFPTLTVDQLVVGEDPLRYLMPLNRGNLGDVITSDGGTATSWEPVLPVESKGDLLYFSSLPRQFSHSDGVTLRNLANTVGNLGSLTIPANSMRVGDVYTLKVIGHLRASTTTGPIFFRFQGRSDAQVLADANTNIVSVNQAIGGVIDPKVPFELKVYFVVRADPALPTLNNVYTYAQLMWSEYPTLEGKSYMEVFPAPAYAWDNTGDIDLSAYGLVVNPGDAEVRVESFEKQFVGYETTGSVTNQELNTTSHVTFRNLEAHGELSIGDPANSSNIYTLPSNDTGRRNDALVSDGSGTVTWAKPSPYNLFRSQPNTTSTTSSTWVEMENMILQMERG